MTEYLESIIEKKIVEGRKTVEWIKFLLVLGGVGLVAQFTGFFIGNLALQFSGTVLVFGELIVHFGYFNPKIKAILGQLDLIQDLLDHRGLL